MNIYEEIFKKYGFSPTQKKIIEMVGEDKTILEIGASSGYMTRAFLANNCVVDAVESDKESARKIPSKVRNLVNISIEDEAIKKELAADYHFIIMADVLEHLINPEKVLDFIHQITNNSTLLISMPNIASWPMRKQLFFQGDFEYQESGLLDKTHLHFYTVKSLINLLSRHGWKVTKTIGTITRLPLEDLINKIPIINLIFRNLLRKRLVERFKNLSYCHFLVVASK